MSLMENTDKNKTYELPDGNIITIDAKRLRCAIHDQGGCSTRV